MNDRIWSDNEAESWDLFVRPSQTKREIAFLTWAFERYADRNVNKVLDLACGTGRLALELAARGYDVTGVDRFASMLSRAREKAETRSIKINLVRAPIQKFILKDHFDAAYCVQALYYILNEQDLSGMLTKMKALIRPGGIFIIDTGNFISIFGTYEKVRSFNRRGKNWQIRRRVANKVDDVNMLFHHIESTVMKLNGKTRSWKETHILRMWTFPELRIQLLEHGFSNIRLFGQQKAGSKEATWHAPRLVIVAKRA